MERRYTLSSVNGTVVFDDNNYIMDSFNSYPAASVIESIDYQVGSEYLTNRLESKDIELVVWCCAPTTSNITSPSATTVSANKFNLQKVCSAFTEVTIKLQEYRSSNWVTLWEIKTYPSSTIEWSTSLEENGPYACRGVIHLRALKPFYSLPIVESGNTFYINSPFSTTTTTVATRSSGSTIVLDNSGDNDKLTFDLRAYKTSGSTEYCAKVTLQVTNLRGENMYATFVATDSSSYLPVSTSQYLIFDSKNFRITSNVTSSYYLYPDRSADPIVFPIGSNTIKFLAYNSSNTLLSTTFTLLGGIEASEV